MICTKKGAQCLCWGLEVMLKWFPFKGGTIWRWTTNKYARFNPVSGRRSSSAYLRSCYVHVLSMNYFTSSAGTTRALPVWERRNKSQPRENRTVTFVKRPKRTITYYEKAYRVIVIIVDYCLWWFLARRLSCVSHVALPEICTYGAFYYEKSCGVFIPFYLYNRSRR